MWQTCKLTGHEQHILKSTYTVNLQDTGNFNFLHKNAFQHFRGVICFNIYRIVIQFIFGQPTFTVSLS
jgi:hypothetical protein